MSVATMLGTSQADAQQLISTRWDAWVQQRPELAQVEDPAELDRWLRGGCPARADVVLRAFVFLAAADGGNDLEAARVLAWVMLPAAQRLARRLSRHGVTDDQVAAQMWIEVRCYPWRLGGRVAPRLAGLLRRHLVASSTRPVEVPLSSLIETTGTQASADELFGAQVLHCGPADPPAMDELIAVLECGRRDGVISRDDQLLLLDVVTSASESLDLWMGSGSQVMARAVSNQVAFVWGTTGRTVRRRTTTTLQKLAAHYGATRDIA